MIKISTENLDRVILFNTFIEISEKVKRLSSIVQNELDFENEDLDEYFEVFDYVIMDLKEQKKEIQLFIESQTNSKK
jgi:predicted solute-binding protein